VLADPDAYPKYGGSRFLQNVRYLLRDYTLSHVYTYEKKKIYIYIYIQGVSRLVDITAGGDFLDLCDQKISYKHVSDFGRLRSYDRLKFRIEGNDY